MKKATATIFEVKHFAVHDGPGIRTTVFFKGCPLKCVWCHNPEGISPQRELSYLEHKCSNCHSCAAVCPSGAHWVDGEGKHRFSREKCILCGKCEKLCVSSCLKLYGKCVSVDELMEELLEDRDFYESSEGGVTLSGGECLTQAEFCAELLQALKKEGIHTAVDTCGFVRRESLEKVVAFTDLFLYDFKAADAAVHRRCTGQENETILENFLFLSSLEKPIEVRIPYVPDWNDHQMQALAELLCKCSSLTGVRVLPYHNYAGSKYASLGMENTLPERLPAEEELRRAKELLGSYGIPVLE